MSGYHAPLGPLFGDTPAPTLPHHDGSTYDPAKDKQRLNAQTQRVYDVMRDGRWRTLRQLSDEAHAPEASVSARLRDLRKDKFGGHTVERRRTDGGLWTYRLEEA